MSAKTNLTDYLAEHPKMTGVLFTLLLLASQGVGTAAAHGSSCYGP